MFGKFFTWLKWFLGFEKEETEILNLLGEPSDKPRSHPKYWQPLIVDGVPEYPHLRGLVEAKVLYGQKTVAQLDQMIQQCTNSAERRRMKRIRLKKNT